MEGKNLFQYVLGALLVLGFFGLMVILVYRVIPESNRDILNLVVGSLIGSFTAVVSYFYGSSLGSKEKSEMLNKKDQPPIV